VGLLPSMSLTGSKGETRYGDMYTFTHGFYNLGFYTGTNVPVGGTPHHNEIGLSVAGIVMICFMALSVILTLIGFAQSSARIFLKNENTIFSIFLVFAIIMGLLMAIAVLIDVPNSTRNADNIFSSKFFKSSTG
jgi:hypothetical protein